MELDTNINDAGTAIQGLADSIATGQTTKNELDGSILSGQTLKSGLDSSIGLGETTKQNLESAIANGKIGNVTDLKTVNRANLVGAINENKENLAEHKLDYRRKLIKK